MNPQVNTPRTLNGGHDPSEMGRRGAAAREANIARQIAENRQRLLGLAPQAIDTLGEVLVGNARPNLAPTAFGILDRTGLGPTSKTEVTVGPSEALVSLIERLDAEDARADVLDVSVLDEAEQAPKQAPKLADDPKLAASWPEDAPSSRMHRLELPSPQAPESVIPTNN